MLYPEVIHELGISPGLLSYAKTRLGTEGLEKNYLHCSQIRASYTVQVDSTPVMDSPLSFAAKIDHRFKSITLNGCLLKKSADREKLEIFLIFHELAHTSGLSEGECDAVALYALQRDADSAKTPIQ